MIKFFRKIRQNLLMENKTGKYFKYAIGEIILVVVGILIALQINNWNEFKKSQKKEALLINQIISDAKADSLFFQSRIKVLKRQDSIVNYVLFINQFPKADTLSNILVNREILPYISFILLSEVLDNYEYSKENIGSWKIKQRLQEYKKAYQFLDSNFNLYNEELQKEIKPIEKNYYRLFRDSPHTTTIDDLRQIYINEELELIFSSLRNRSKYAMVEVEKIIPINNKLMEELKEYKLTITD